MTSNALLHPPPHTPPQQHPHPRDRMGHSSEYRVSRLDHKLYWHSLVQIGLQSERVSCFQIQKSPPLVIYKQYYII